MIDCPKMLQAYKNALAKNDYALAKTLSDRAEACMKGGRKKSRKSHKKRRSSRKKSRKSHKKRRSSRKKSRKSHKKRRSSRKKSRKSHRKH